MFFCRLLFVHFMGYKYRSKYSHKNQWRVWKGLILQTMSFQAGGPSISSTNLCNLLCQFVDCIFFSWKGGYWICYSSVVLNSRNCRRYYPGARRKAEIFLNVVSLLHMFAICCCCSAVSFLTCVINLLEMCLPFPLSYTRETEFSYVTASQCQHV